MARIAISCTSRPEEKSTSREGRTEGSMSAATMIMRGPGLASGGMDSRNSVQPERKRSAPPGYMWARSSHPIEEMSPNQGGKAVRAGNLVGLVMIPGNGKQGTGYHF